MKELYKTIKGHIEVGQEQGCKHLIMGDFNAEVGGIVKYGDKEANKGGKELVKMCEESDMEITYHFPWYHFALEEREGT